MTTQLYSMAFWLCSMAFMNEKLITQDAPSRKFISVMLKYNGIQTMAQKSLD